MAETQFSLGVVTIENDQPIINTQPIQVGAAIIGPTVKGPNEIPTTCTSYSDYVSKYGDIFTSGSQTFSYLTSISAYNYFQAGGTTLLVTRVTSGSFTPATSTLIPNAVESGVLSTETNALLGSFTSVSGSTQTLTAVGASGSVSGTGATLNVVLDTTSSISTVTVVSPGSGYTIGETLTVGTSSMVGNGAPLLFTLNANDIVNTNSFTLETLSEGEIMNSASPINSDGSLQSGSIDNLRWEIQSPDTDEGTFSLLIRRGNDDTESPVILETWNNLSLDPTSPNYIEKAIGNQKEQILQDGAEFYVDLIGNYTNQSQYVRVKSINSPTYEYLDNAGDPKTEFTGSIPIVSTGSFEGAVGSNIPGPSAGAGQYYEKISNAGNTQGLASSDYTQAINLLANKEEFKYNYITVPGLIKDFATHASNISALITKCQERGDALAIIDLEDYQSQLLEVTTEAKSINSSYAAAYWPWVQTIDPSTSQQVFVPASTIIPSVFAFNDAAAEVWNAPAGTARGVMSTVIRAEKKLTKSQRDSLYKANVNPLTTLTNTGVTVFGQKTLKKKQSATDRINVRRLLIELKNQLGNLAENLVFEQNTAALRNDFITQANAFLSSVQQRQGLTDFRVVMDETNNTPNVIDNNQLIGAIFIKPTKTAEFISLNFNITSTGATFN
jgi:uncharacterized protein